MYNNLENVISISALFCKHDITSENFNQFTAEEFDFWFSGSCKAKRAL